MAQPTPGDVHVDVALSNVSIAYRNPSYIADQIFPIVPVDKQSDLYYIWTKDFWFRNYVAKRAPSGQYPEGGLELSTTNYATIQYALAYPLPDELIRNQDSPIDMRKTGADWLGDQFMLNRELLFASNHFTTSVWATDLALTGTDRWDDYNSPDSDPVADFELAMETVELATGVKPNLAVMGTQVWNKLRRNPSITGIFRNNNVPNPVLNLAQVAEVLGVEKILVGSAVQTTSNEGAATETRAYIWGKSCLIVYVTPTPALMTPNSGYTFVWNVDDGGLQVQIKDIRDDLRDRNVLNGKHAFDQKVVGTELGYFLSTVIS